MKPDVQARVWRDLRDDLAKHDTASSHIHYVEIDLPGPLEGRDDVDINELGKLTCRYALGIDNGYRSAWFTGGFPRKPFSEHQQMSVIGTKGEQDSIARFHTFADAATRMLFPSVNDTGFSSGPYVMPIHLWMQLIVRSRNRLYTHPHLQMDSGIVGFILGATSTCAPDEEHVSFNRYRLASDCRKASLAAIDSILDDFDGDAVAALLPGHQPTAHDSSPATPATEAGRSLKQISTIIERSEGTIREAMDAAGVNRKNRQQREFTSNEIHHTARARVDRLRGKIRRSADDEHEIERWESLVSQMGLRLDQKPRASRR